MSPQLVNLFSFVQPSKLVPQRYGKQVLITNILSFLFFWVTLGIVLFFYSIFGYIDTLSYILGVAFLFMAIPALNYFGYHRAARVVLCVIPAWLTMAITIQMKMTDSSPQTLITYFDSRFIIMASAILPGIVFRLEERWQLILCLAPAAFFLFFYESIHQIFGVGYFQRGFSDPGYTYLNYIVSVTYSVLLFGILLLRSVLEKSERDLQRQNFDLVEKQNEIEAQHEELLQHQEEMLTSSEKLEQANRLITKQQEALEKYNETLEALVEEKSFELLRTNDELVKHNSELLQFSYTVSHNLRGPVARMLGLTRLLKGTRSHTEREELQDMILRSSEELDEILKDLSLIIDIRNDLYRVREKVFLEEEWNKAASLLGENVKSVYELNVDFSDAPYIYGVRPMIQSIFYNLFSNAIKYQSPDRKLKVTISSRRLEDRKTLITIADNGLGIDLKNQQRNLFKLYKRFHTHVTGKGLGLYLVKTQLDTLGATVSVQSAPDQGTTFQLVFSRPDEVSRQVFYENDAVDLSYDGTRNLVMIQWKRGASSREYREAFEALIASLNVYHSVGWISDVTLQGPVSEEDQEWLATRIFPEVLKSGVKCAAVVGLNSVTKREYYERLAKLASGTGREIRSFPTIEEAIGWVDHIAAYA